MGMPDIRTLVPHSSPMLLLDEVVEIDKDGLTASVTIRPDSPFIDGPGVGAWIGIEYMAQAIAAFAGYEATHKGDPVTPGFLLGTRCYTCSVPFFPVGSALRVTVRQEFRGAGGLASFKCTIVGDGILAEAAVSVYQPDDVDAFLEHRTT